METGGTIDNQQNFFGGEQSEVWMRGLSIFSRYVNRPEL